MLRISVHPLPQGRGCTSRSAYLLLISVQATQLSLLRGIAMHGIDPQYRLRLLDRLDVDVDCHRLTVGAYQHAFQHFVTAGIDLLMRNVRRHEDEVPGAGL